MANGNDGTRTLHLSEQTVGYSCCWFLHILVLKFFIRGTLGPTLHNYRRDPASLCLNFSERGARRFITIISSVMDGLWCHPQQPLSKCILHLTMGAPNPTFPCKRLAGTSSYPKEFWIAQGELQAPISRTELPVSELSDHGETSVHGEKWIHGERSGHGLDLQCEFDYWSIVYLSN